MPIDRPEVTDILSGGVGGGGRVRDPRHGRHRTLTSRLGSRFAGCQWFVQVLGQTIGGFQPRHSYTVLYSVPIVDLSAWGLKFLRDGSV